jgi:hypothetical protein
MKKFEELTPEECQSFLNELFDETDTEFKQLITQPEENMGIEYSVKSEDFDGGHCHVSITNPELLTWMYQHEVDMIMPLTRLKYDYIEMDETNSVLFEYAMEVGKIINEYTSSDRPEYPNPLLHEMGPVYAKDLEAIVKIQKDLINRL